MSKLCSCGTPIEFVKLQSGKLHPVEGDYLDWEDADSGKVLVTDGGNLYTVDHARQLASVHGRLSHFQFCPDAKDFSKKWKK